MKKLLFALLAAVTFLSTAIAVPTKYNESKPENWSDITYVTVPIYKIYDSVDGYVVVYAKKRYGTGSTTIPKKWSKGNKEAPAKLKIRSIGGGRLKPYMTIVKKGDAFHHVILNLPASRNDVTWGVVDPGKKLEGLDKEVLEDLDI